MKTINTDISTFFDVDNTLVMWKKSDEYNQEVVVKDPYDGKEETLYVNTCHVKLLLRKKAQKKLVVVWSAGGALWAEAVVKALKLTEHVDVCMAKPAEIVDDIPLKQWSNSNLYLKEGYGK